MLSKLKHQDTLKKLHSIPKKEIQYPHRLILRPNYIHQIDILYTTNHGLRPINIFTSSISANKRAAVKSCAVDADEKLHVRSAIATIAVTGSTAGNGTKECPYGYFKSSGRN